MAFIIIAPSPPVQYAKSAYLAHVSLLPIADTGDGWKLAQRMFQESGLALRCNDDSFIWTCEVRVPQKKSSQLKGFLMEDPGLVLGEKVPVNNPWLKLVPAQE
ncbi:DNA-binding domain-containing protein [Enterobacter asburiae]|nr:MULTISPECIES: DNA-binding domain-containing protein [Enterobacter]MCK7456279.1 DNA-binding domain-containing protein [Enterobacter asburiae]